MKDMERIRATRQITEYPETRIVTATDYDDLELLKTGAEPDVLKANLLSIVRSPSSEPARLRSIATDFDHPHLLD